MLCTDDPRDLQGQLEDDLKRARLLHYESHNPSPGGGGGGGGYPGMWTTTSSALAATTPTIIGGGGSRWSPSTPPGIKEEKQQHLTVGGVGLTDLHSPSGGAPHSGHSPSGGMHSPSSYPPPSFADSIVFTAAPPPPNTTSSGGGTGDILYDTINMSQSAYTPISHSGKQRRYF